MSSRIFEKMADQKLSAFREMTADHRFYGSEKVENDTKELKKKKEE